MIGSRLAHCALFTVLLIGCSAALAGRTPRSEISNTAVGEVCFENDACVKVVSVRGSRYEGAHTYNLSASSEWVTGVYDAKGKIVGKVKTGGDVVVISTEVYARRDAGQKTYTIHRIDGKTKPIKTPYRAITTSARRRGWDNWLGTHMGGFGSTEFPKFSTFRDVYPIAGSFGGITADGRVQPFSEAISTAYAYGDYFVVADPEGKHFIITDHAFQKLSPVLENLALHTTAYDETMSDTSRFLGGASRRIVFSVKNKIGEGGRELHRPLPMLRGEQFPADLIGLAPILNQYGRGNPCEAELGAACRRDLRGWVAIWASADGSPKVSIEEPRLRRFTSARYKSVHWNPYEATFIAAVAETLDGQFRVLPYKVEVTGDMTMSMLPDTYASLDVANNAITYIQNQRATELWNRVLADQQAAHERYAAWEAARAEEDRQRAARAAAEDTENAAANTLIAAGDADAICKQAFKASSFYARTNLFDACSRLRPAAPTASRGFWGDLAAGLAAYNRDGASGATAGTGTSTTYTSSSNSGDFNRSMQNIDTALRVISDPNWNGAAAAAW